jgi:hypothetical protein
LAEGDRFWMVARLELRERLSQFFAVCGSKHEMIWFLSITSPMGDFVDEQSLKYKYSYVYIYTDILMGDFNGI